MSWWLTITVDPTTLGTSTYGYVNSAQVQALTITTFVDTVHGRNVYYIGTGINGTFLNTIGFLGFSDALTAAQEWCGGRND